MSWQHVASHLSVQSGAVQLISISQNAPLNPELSPLGVPPLPPRPAYDSARCGAGVFAVFENLHAVDEDVDHAGGVLVRSFEGGVVGDLLWIEDHHIGEIALFEHASTFEPEVRGRESAPPADARERRREIRRQEAQERNRLYRERKLVEESLAPLEAKIAETEKLVRELESRQADPEVYADPERAGEVGREKSAAESLLERLYGEWESLASRLHGESAAGKDPRRE